MYGIWHMICMHPKASGAANFHGERGTAALPGAAEGAAEGACRGHPHARGHWFLADLGGEPTKKAGKTHGNPTENPWKTPLENPGHSQFPMFWWRSPTCLEHEHWGRGRCNWWECNISNFTFIGVSMCIFCQDIQAWKRVVADFMGLPAHVFLAG